MEKQPKNLKTKKRTWNEVLVCVVLFCLGIKCCKKKKKEIEIRKFILQSEFLSSLGISSTRLCDCKRKYISKFMINPQALNPSPELINTQDRNTQTL